jgi:hypothetical protein
MVIRLQALSRLRWGRDLGDIHTSALMKVDNDGHRTVIMAVGTAVSRSRALAVGVAVTGADGHVIPPPPDPMPGEIQLALNDAAVDDALYFLQRSNPSWSEIYKVYEIVQHDIKRKGIVANGWATDRELRRLTATANHPALAGRDARHARQSAPPIADPLTLPEAQDLVGRIVRAWIAIKTSGKVSAAPAYRLSPAGIVALPGLRVHFAFPAGDGEWRFGARSDGEDRGVVGGRFGASD